MADIITVRYIWLNQRKSEVLNEICKVSIASWQGIWNAFVHKHSHITL